MFITQNEKIEAKIETYVREVCTRVKLREVHPEISLELKSHLREIIDEYIADGFSEELAIEKAIKQMGSPNLVGQQFNEVHKPKPDWSILLLSLFLTTLGILATYLIELQGLSPTTGTSLFARSLVYGVIGGLAVIALYHFDYRRLEHYSKYIYLGTSLLMIIALNFGHKVNGQPYLYLSPLHLNVAGISPLFFSIALAGLLNGWDWYDTKKVFQGLLFCIFPLTLILSSSSMSATLVYMVSGIVIAIISGAKARHFIPLAGAFCGLITLAIISAPYRLARLLYFVNPERDPLGGGWINLQIEKLLANSGFWGHGFTLKGNFLPELDTDFVFSYLTFTFGWVAAFVIVSLIVLLLVRMVYLARRVKNNYAQLLLAGFVATLATQFAWNIAMNLGVAPISGVILPFISYGGSQLVFNAAAMGVVSSIYRLRNISGGIQS